MLLALAATVAVGCGTDDTTAGLDAAVVHDPDLAPVVSVVSVVSVDRFAPGTATLFARTVMTGLPAANAPIDFDQGPFVTRGLGPDGRSVRYYNLDVQRRKPVS